MQKQKKKSKQTSSSSQLQVVSTPLTGAVAAAVAATSPVVGAVSVLAGIVLVHEAGHYLAARSFNISVVEFSIGFGPKIVGFEAIGNEFNLRALPLGGYVRFPEHFDIAKFEQQQEAAQQAFMNRRSSDSRMRSSRMAGARCIWPDR